MLDRSSALETRTTTRGQDRVQLHAKVAGGSRTVITRTWTASTTAPATTPTLRWTLMVWCGITLRATGATRWGSLNENQIVWCVNWMTTCLFSSHKPLLHYYCHLQCSSKQMSHQIKRISDRERDKNISFILTKGANDLT